MVTEKIFMDLLESRKFHKQQIFKKKMAALVSKWLLQQILQIFEN